MIPRLARLTGIVSAIGLTLSCGHTAPSCTYLVTPSQIALPATGGSATITVTTGDSCTWTVTPTETWFVIVATPVRTGYGTVQLFAGPNTGAARTGTLTIAQQNIQVTQGTQPTFSLSGRIKEAWVDIGLAGAQVSVAGASAEPATTDRDGDYAIAGLPPGTYVVTLSRPFFQSRTQNVTISGNTTLSAGLLADTTFPLTAADVRGSWAGGGPYPDEPFRLTLAGSSTALVGWYIDRRDSSDSVTGTYSGRSLVFRVPVADGVLTFECTVDDERHAHGFVKNDRLGGNFPIALTR